MAKRVKRQLSILDVQQYDTTHQSAEKSTLKNMSQPRETEVATPAPIQTDGATTAQKMEMERQRPAVSTFRFCPHDQVDWKGMPIRNPAR
jgi:hypothetical protein